jgi:serine protease
MPDGVLQNTIKVGDPTISDYYGFMGTSMASPHVAGVAALVVAQGIHDPVQVEKILVETARQPNAQKYERDRYGAGIVDAPAAIRKARGEANEARTAAAQRRTGGQLAAVILGLFIAGAVATTRPRAMRLGASYLVGVVAGVATFVGLGILGIGGSSIVQSALLPLLALGLGYGVAKLRAPLAGAAAGAAGHLFVMMVMPAALGVGTAWLGLNALACIWLARAAVRR